MLGLVAYGLLISLWFSRCSYAFLFLAVGVLAYSLCIFKFETDDSISLCVLNELYFFDFFSPLTFVNPDFYAGPDTLINLPFVCFSYNMP